MEPTISVVIPVYNGADHLGTTITSILRQNFADFELLIVDDGSTDGSRDVAHHFASTDARIRVVERPRKEVGGSGSGARNHGIAVARGAFIAAQDHDDVALPHRLETQLRFLQAHDLDAVGGQADVIGGNEGHYWFPQDHAAIRIETIFRPALFQTTKLVRTAIMRAIPYSEGLIDDYDWLVRALAGGVRMGNVPETVAQYRLWPGQTTQRDRARLLRDFRRARFQHCFATLPGLTPAEFLLLDKLANRLTLNDGDEVEAAGEWLVRLSRHPAPLLHARMRRRWAEACDGAAYAVAEGLRADVDQRIGQAGA